MRADEIKEEKGPRIEPWRMPTCSGWMKDDNPAEGGLRRNSQTRAEPKEDSFMETKEGDNV